jgi:glyoxylate utilization-related uncharacterized protein
MSRFLLTIAPLVLAAGCAATATPAPMAPAGPLETAVWPLDKVESKKFDWGELRLCHMTAETYGTKDTLVGYVILNPGKENHPPHQHAEEEFMEITEGEGTWHLNGKDVPAKKGDVVYAAPRSALVKRRGRVTPERCRAIAERVIRALGLAGL